jgi:DNA-binding MarR family transcriptional regulator
VAKRLDLPFDPIARAAEIWGEKFGPAEAMAAVTSIMRAQQLLLAELDGLLRPYGLTFARYEALILLTFSRRGALPLRVIGERLMVHPTSVTNTIDRLEEQRMVVRRPNPRDGRGTLAEITALGRDVAERATGDLMAARFGMGGYGPGELGQVFTLLRGLRLEAGDFVAEPGEAAGTAEPAGPAGATKVTGPAGATKVTGSARGAEQTGAAEPARAAEPAGGGSRQALADEGAQVLPPS